MSARLAGMAVAGLSYLLYRQVRLPAPKRALIFGANAKPGAPRLSLYGRGHFALASGRIGTRWWAVKRPKRFRREA